MKLERHKCRKRFSSKNLARLDKIKLLAICYSSVEVSIPSIDCPHTSYRLTIPFEQLEHIYTSSKEEREKYLVSLDEIINPPDDGPDNGFRF